MPLPRAERAVVEPRKIRDYLLSSSHPLGRFKAAFFDALGYSDEDWGALVIDLRLHAVRGDLDAQEATPYGEKYRVRGPPSGSRRKGSRRRLGLDYPSR